MVHTMVSNIIRFWYLSAISYISTILYQVLYWPHNISQ